MACSEVRRWRAHVRSQVRSGLSQADYCRLWGIPRREFAAWRRRLWVQEMS
ncbi:IS66 family insertion sequence element accessory protein TnpA, partial [Aquimonas sp.]|uniref:IS66 family insertion sequence element accessory protein TnpA n=1 Tax=Aquimonas sp. TaxID=1872588 RepID=UPI0037BF1CDA